MVNGPISPEQVQEVKLPFPQEVFDVFNELIALNFSGSYAKIYAKDASSAIAERLGISKAEVFQKRYLDIENAYRGKGWKVYYDQPGYNESYDSFYEFRK